MLGDTAGEDRHVVSPFQDADDSPLGVRLGHVHDGACQFDEILHVEAQAPDGVLRVCVETCADEDQFGAASIGQGLQASTEGGVILRPGRAVTGAGCSW